MLKLASRTATDPLRAELAAAIEAHSKVEASIRDQRSRLSRADLMVDAATAALKAASAEAAQIKAKRVAAAAAGDVTPDKSMRDARLREQDAIDGLEIAKAAQTSISDGAPDLARDLDVARKRVEAAARAVIVGAAPELIERAKLAYAELESVRNALSFVHECFPFPPSDASKNVEGFGRREWGEPDSRQAREWHAALESLLVDSETPLPD